jgi:hypothetical protein
LKIENQVVRLRLVGAKRNAAVTGSDELPGKADYFIGNNPKKWRTNVPTYGKVRYHNVYPGVDLDYYGNQGGQLEYDFIVAPGADPNAIALDVGAGLVPARGRPQGLPLRIDADGDLVIGRQGGEIRFHKPEIYQPAESSSLITRHSSLVDGRFVLDARNRVHFALGAYDHTKPLVIDPVLSYSTYLGGSGGDFGSGIAVDSSGSAYVTGGTQSVDFPTSNPFQASNNSALGTGFVAKLNPSGSALVYSTYLGGGGTNAGYAIAVDASGNAYVTGMTSSPDFPTVNPFQASNNSALGTGFVAKLNPSGSALVYSTYLGGSVADVGNGIAVDSSGNAHVTGDTLSTDFPVTSGAFQTTGPGATCNALTNPAACGYAFVTELDPTGSALVFSTFLGGTKYNAGSAIYNVGSAIAVDSSGFSYVTGATSSADFPTAKPLQATLNGSTNAFVAKLNASGSALVYSTYLGGSRSDQGTSIVVDSSGSAYVTGFTSSSNFPTVNPLQATNKVESAGNQTGFVAKLNPTGSALVYSTYLGGSLADWAYGIALDSSGDVYVVGQTSSTDFPTVNPIQATYNAGGSTAFAAELNASGSALVYSTYLGGSGLDGAMGVAVNSFGDAYVTGNTTSTDFPTVNPLQPVNKFAAQAGGTAFVAELSPGPAPALSFSPSVLNFGSVIIYTTAPGKTVTVANLGNAPLTITAIASSGEFAVDTATSSCLYSVSTLAPEGTCMIDVTFTPTTLGLSTGALTVTDNASGSPQALQLTGNSPLSAAAISPAYLEFTTYIGTPSSPQAVTLTNTAPVVLTVGTVTFAGDNSEWTQTNNCLPSVGPNMSCTINVVFQPTFGGPHESTLTVTDDASNSPQTVGLSGTANSQGPASLSPTSLTFGDQPVGTTSPAQTIMLVNPGGPGVPDRSSFVYKARFFSRCLAWRQLDVLWRAGLLTTGPAG